MTFFTEIEKGILKFTWKHKRPKISNGMLDKRAMLGEIHNTSNHITERQEQKQQVTCTKIET
jgi:hypothetical protein